MAEDDNTGMKIVILIIFIILVYFIYQFYLLKTDPVGTVWDYLNDFLKSLNPFDYIGGILTW